MKIKEKYTRASLRLAIERYAATHRCGTPLRKGFLNCIFVDKDGKTDSDHPDPVPVPYCEDHDPPDGFNHTYTRMVIVKP